MKNKFIIVLCFICFGLTCKAELIRSVGELQSHYTYTGQEAKAPQKTETSVSVPDKQAPQKDETNVSEQEKQNPQEAETAETNDEQPAAEETNPDEVKPSGELVEQAIKHKVPMGMGNIIKKFLLAMLCVAGSCIFLYVVLRLFKRGKKKESIADRIITDYENTLDTPQNLDDAINIFLDKNKL